MPIEREANRQVINLRRAAASSVLQEGIACSPRKASPFAVFLDSMDPTDRFFENEGYSAASASLRATQGEKPLRDARGEQSADDGRQHWREPARTGRGPSPAW